METPASIEVIDASVMRARGYTKLSDSIQEFSWRCNGRTPNSTCQHFQCADLAEAKLPYLEMVYGLARAAMVMRPQNTFNLEQS